MRRFVFLVSLVGVVTIAPMARAVDGPYAGIDLGMTVPANQNYQSLVNYGATGNPFAGYMFNQYLGLQGHLQFTFQTPDGSVRGFRGAQQWTSLFGATGGPRLQMPLSDWGLGLYFNPEGGYFTGLSGRVTRSAPGFSIGGGIEYNLLPQVAVGLCGYFNRMYAGPRPTVVAGQTSSERGPADARWVTAGVTMRYSFNQPEAAPAPPPPMAPAAAAPVKRKIVLRSVHFDFDKSTIRPDAVPVLDEAALLLKNDRAVPILIVGHTDNVGSQAYNIRLSQRRANAVADYLIRHGIAAGRIRTEGVGFSQPVASNATPEGRAENRRVEIHLE